jgi:hypothetical protein
MKGGVMKRILGVLLIVAGGAIVLLLIPFLAHALVNVIYVLLLGQPVPGWWWTLIKPLQNVVALPIVAFAFVIKVGPMLSLVLPAVVEVVLAAVGAVILWLGLRTVRSRTRPADRGSG